MIHERIGQEDTTSARFLKLQSLCRRLFAEGRTTELLRTAFGLLKLENGSEAALRFLLFRLPGDTIFAHKASDQPFKIEKAAVFYRLAELCRDKCAFAEMKKLLALYLRDGRDPLTTFSALCLTGELWKAYAGVTGLLDSSPSAETLFFMADPWANIYRANRIKAALSAVEAARDGLKGPVKELADIHRFILSEKAGLKPDFKMPRETRPSGSVLYLPAAEILMDRHEFKKAEKFLRAAADAWPANELACGKLAEALFCGGKKKAALKLLASRQKLISSPGFRAWRGQMLLFSGRYDESIKELNRTIAAGNSLGWCWRGAALFKLGRNGPAMKNLSAAIKTAPDDLEARVWRAELLRTIRKPGLALEDLNRVLTIMPKHTWALANLALLTADSGDRAGFAAHYSRLPESVKLACKRGGGGPAALAGLLTKLKGIRRHEPRFYHNFMTR